MSKPIKPSSACPMFSASSNEDIPRIVYAPNRQHQEYSEDSTGDGFDNEPLILGSPAGKYVPNMFNVTRFMPQVIFFFL